MESAAESAAPRWRALDRIARRVAGVLVEKAKTTPENYPLSLNSLVTGCNQKSNRFPQMQLDEAQVEEALDHLRHMGAVALIQGDGRVDKYRHLLYEWLGVDKVELAVMGELLLRGAQTLGELRGRAARMEPIRDIGALYPIVDALHRKRLVQYLTPPGRGCTISHNLYEAQELPKLRQEFGDYADPGPGAASLASFADSEVAPRPTAAAPAATPSIAPPAGAPAAAPSRTPTPAADTGELDAVRREVAELRTEVAELRSELAELREALGETA